MVLKTKNFNIKWQSKDFLLLKQKSEKAGKKISAYLRELVEKDLSEDTFIVEKRVFLNGEILSKKVMYVTKSIEEAHKAKKILEKSNNDKKNDFRVVELGVPTSLKELEIKYGKE